MNLWPYSHAPWRLPFPISSEQKMHQKFTAFLGISSRVETRGGNRLKKGGKFWTRAAICSFALDISTIGQQFQHFFVTLRAPVLHLSFAFHFAFVCRLEIYEAPSTVFAQRGEYQACRKSFKSLFSYKLWSLNCKLKIVNKLSVNVKINQASWYALFSGATTENEARRLWKSTIRVL